MGDNWHATKPDDSSVALGENGAQYQATRPNARVPLMDSM